SNLTSQRDVGVQLWGDIANAFVRYELAILNGTPDGAITDLDNDHAKSYAGRIFVRPHQLGDLARYGDLGVAFAFETGNEKGSATSRNGAAAHPWLPSLKRRGKNTFFTSLPGGTDMAQAVFALKPPPRLNPQLYYYVGGFGLLAERVKEYQQVRKNGED